MVAYQRIGRILGSDGFPFAQIKYVDIRSDLLKGRVGIYDVDIVPMGAEYGIPVESIYVETGNPLDLALLAASGSGGDYVGPLKIGLQAVELDTRAEWLQTLQKAADAEADPAALCKKSVFGGLGDLSRLGQDQVVIDGFFAMVPDPGSGLRNRYGLDFVNLSSLRVEVDIAGARTISDARNRRGMVQRLEFQYSEPEQGYTSRMLSLCAGLEGMALDAYVAERSKRLRSQWEEQGVGISDDIFRALENFLRNPSSIDLTLRSTNGASAEDLRKTDGDLLELQELFDVFLTVNEKAVRNVKLSRLARKQDGDGANAGGANGIKDLQTLRREYRQVSPGELDGYLGHTVRIQADRKEYEGTLSSMDERSIEVTRLILGGKMAVPVSRKDITKAEVLLFQVQ